MKKLQVVCLFLLMAGCSSSQKVLPSVTPGDLQTPSLFPTQTATPTSIPPLILTAIGGGAGKLAFTSERNGISEIYMVNADGSNMLRLTNNDARDYSPVWSP